MILTVQVWYEGLASWESIGSNLPSNKDIYLAVFWSNDYPVVQTGHVELVVDSGGVRSIPAYQGQDTSAANGTGVAVAFGPFRLQGGVNRIKATLSYNNSLVDSKEFAVSVPDKASRDDSIIQVPVEPAQAGVPPQWGWIGVSVLALVIFAGGEARVIKNLRRA